MADAEAPGTKMKDGEKLARAPLQVSVDAVMQLGLGAFVSTVVLGTQVGPNSAEPSVQLSMPTNSLLNFAHFVLNAFRDRDTALQIARGHADFQRELERELEAGGLLPTALGSKGKEAKRAK